MDSASTTTVSTGTAVPWEPVRLSQAHRYMIEQDVRGVPLRRIQSNLKRYGDKYCGSHIKKVITSKLGQEYASLVSAQIHGGIPGLVQQGADHLPEAVSTQLEVMRNPFAGERHRLNAAQDHMDRFGLPKISRQEGNGPQQPVTITINYTPEQMRHYLQGPPVIETELIEPGDPRFPRPRGLNESDDD